MNYHSIYRLIHSLNKNEKKFFKAFATRHSSDTNYNLVLFNAIEKQKQSNEDELLQKLKGNKLLNNYSFNKHYLYTSILRSLHIINHNSSVASELQEQVHYIEMLHRRGFYDQCIKLIKKAKQKALEQEQHTAFIDLARLELETIVSISGNKNLYDKITVIEEEIKEQQLFLKESMQMHINALKMHGITEKLGYESSIEKSKEFQKLHESTEEIKAKTGYTKIFQTFFRFAYAIYTKKSEAEVGEQSKVAVELFNANPEFARQNPKRYYAALTNYAGWLNHIKKFDEAQKQLDFIKTKIDSRVLNTRYLSAIYYNHISLQLEVYLTTKQFKAAYDFIKPILHSKELYKEDFMSERLKITIYYLAAYALFKANDTKEAGRLISKMITEFDPNVRSDIHVWARLLQLMLYFENKNVYLLEHIINAASRFLKKNSNYYDCQKILLDFIKQNIKNIHDGKKIQQNAKEAYEKLHQIIEVDKKVNKDIFVYIDFPEWIKNIAEKGFK